MSQYSNLAVSNSIINVKDVPCQLTGYTVYNPNTTDVWLKFVDSIDGSSTATGRTSVYKLLIPAGAQFIEYQSSGSVEDPDGIWAFEIGMDIKCVTGYLHGNTTPPTTPIEVFLQIKP